jgi:flagellar biosynthetic protein FliR
MLADLLVANVYQTLLVFARIGAAVMILPGFGEGFVYPRARLALALLLSVVVAPVVAPGLPAMPASDGAALGLVVREVLVGLAIGGIIRFLIAGVGIAGAIIATQTGLAAASMFDPAQGDQIAVVGRFLTVAVTVALFAADLHHSMLSALADSYVLMPPLQPPPVGDVADLALEWFGAAFLVATQLAAPLIIAGIVFFLGLGVLARLMPQMPVFFVVIPVQIGAGIALFMIALSTMMLWYLDFVADRLDLLVAG